MIRFSGNMKKLKLCRILIINYYCWLIILLVQKIGIPPSFSPTKKGSCCTWGMILLLQPLVDFIKRTYFILIVEPGVFAKYCTLSVLWLANKDLLEQILDYAKTCKEQTLCAGLFKSTVWWPFRLVFERKFCGQSKKLCFTICNQACDWKKERVLEIFCQEVMSYNHALLLKFL